MPKNFESWMSGEDREAFDLPTENVALIVVDMQNHSLKDLPGQVRDPDRDLSGFRAAIPGCVAMVKAARAAGHPIVFMKYVYLPGHGDKPVGKGRASHNTRKHGGHVPGMWGGEIIDDLAPREGEFVLEKSHPSSFYGTRLEPLLVSRGIKNVVICGITTNICVETTARDANQRGYDTYVISDATGEFEPSRHWHSLYTIEWWFGSVVTVADAQRSWAYSPALAITRRPSPSTKGPQNAQEL